MPQFVIIFYELCQYKYKVVSLRCQKEFENRDGAAKGDDAVRKRFHAFVLFLAELYLNLEVKNISFWLNCFLKSIILARYFVRKEAEELICRVL